MGWEIMGTDHLKPSEPAVLSDEEVVEQAIDWLENAGMTLLPWQAAALRAVMLQPVKSRFIVDTPRQHPQQRGFTSDAIVFDEAN